VKEIRARLLIGPEIAEFDGSKTILKDPAAFLHGNPACGFRVTEILGEANQSALVRDAKKLIVDFIRSINVPKYTDARLANGKMLIDDWAELNAAELGDTGLSDERIFTDEICLFQAAEEYAAQRNIAAPAYEEIFQDAMADHRVLTRDGKTAFYALLPYRKDFLRENAYTEDGQPNAAIFRGLTMQKRTEGHSNYIEVSLLYNKIKYSTRYDESKWLEPSPQKRSFPPISVWPNSRDDAKIWSVYYTFAGLRFDEDEDAHNWLALDFSVLTFDNRKTVETTGNHFIEQHNVAAKKYVDCEYEIIQTGTYPHVLLGRLAENGKHIGAYAMTSGGQGINTVPDRTAIIGIDFGTSNTVAFYSMHNGDTLEQPKPIDFKNANVQPAIVNDVFD
jgi:hypothetical protein